MARLCPGYEDVCRNACGNVVPHAEEEEGGCGSSAGRTVGDDMNGIEAVLAVQNRPSEVGPDIEIPVRSLKKDQKNSRVTAAGKKATPTQTLGECERCGYMSSQKICKACVLLEGLNKNRPKTDVAIGVDIP